MDWKQIFIHYNRSAPLQRAVLYSLFFFLPQQPDFSQDNTTMGSMDSLTKTCTQKHHISLICQLESFCCVKPTQNLSYPHLFPYAFNVDKYLLIVAIRKVFGAFNSLLMEFLKRSRTNIRATETKEGKREASILIHITTDSAFSSQQGRAVLSPLAQNSRKFQYF